MLRRDKIQDRTLSNTTLEFRQKEGKLERKRYRREGREISKALSLIKNGSRGLPYSGVSRRYNPGSSKSSGC